MSEQQDPYITQKPVPGDYRFMSQWFNVIRSIRSQAATGGPAIITVRVLVDKDGNPLRCWSSVGVNRLFPARDVEEVIGNIINELVE